MSDSVPQEVKCRFSGRHPRAPATLARPSSTRALASRPRGYWEEGVAELIRQHLDTWRPPQAGHRRGGCVIQIDQSYGFPHNRSGRPCHRRQNAYNVDTSLIIIPENRKVQGESPCELPFTPGLQGEPVRDPGHGAGAAPPGHELVDFEDSADAYIINTCSVTAVSDKKSRQMIRRARRPQSQAVVAACGCYVQTHTDEAKEPGHRPDRRHRRPDGLSGPAGAGGPRPHPRVAVDDSPAAAGL